MDKPFVGLVPFAERDAAYFFGRQSERRVLVDNLLASRLTLLYGESGAGKSSLLNAGVVSELRPAPEFVVVVFRSWREDPLLGLAESIQKATGTVVLNTTKAGLCEVIKTCTAPRIAAEVVSPAASLVGNGKGTDNPTEREERRTLLIILDQFEEYFHYHPGIDSFDKELARALGARDVPANFLISVREDWLAALDRFKGRIPGLFDNYLRMQHLSRKGATEAIEGPLQTFNQLHKNGDSVSWDEDLTERVINSILSSQSTLERGLQSEDRVQAPYLQMVMSTLWRREQELNSRRLRVKTLEDDLKGARHIYESHFATTLNKELTDEERKVAPAIFACFVTGTGRKQNQTVHDVSANTGIPEALVGGMVGKLRNALVLTQTPPPKGAGRDEVGYEFAHDVLAEAALKYVRQEAVEAERRKAEDAEKRAIAEAQAARRLRFLLGGLVALLIIAAAAVGVAWVQAKRAETERKKALILQDAAYQARGQAVKNETKALAEAVVSAADSANLRYEFDLAVLLASYARHHSEDFPDVAANAEAVLRSALMSVDAQELHGVEDIMLNTIAWSPDSTRLAGADEDSVYVWDLRKKFPFKDDLSGADAVAWSADGKWLAESDGSLRDGKTAEYLELVPYFV